jgi:hypothetical protein
MNRELAERAWNKGLAESQLSIKDWVRGAVCYYRGFSTFAEKGHKSASIIAQDIEKALKAYVSGNNISEIDHVLKKRLGKERRKIPSDPPATKDELIEQHWAQLSPSIWKPAAEAAPPPSGFHDPETGVTTGTVKVQDLKPNQIKWDHQFDDETISRLRRIHEILGEAGHWKDFDGLVDGFLYDMNPYGEIGIYERMTDAYRLVLKLFAGELPREQKEHIYSTLILFSMGKVENIFGMPARAFYALLEIYRETSEGQKIRQAIERL